MTKPERDEVYAIMDLLKSFGKAPLTVNQQKLMRDVYVRLFKLTKG